MNIKKIVNRKFVALAVLLAIILAFFWPEISLILNTAGNNLTNTCFIQTITGKNCNPVEITLLNEKKIGLGLPLKPTFSFKTNLSPNEISKQNSTVSLLIAAEREYNIPLTDPMVTISPYESGSIIVIKRDQEIAYSTTIILQLRIVSITGDSGYNWIYGSTGENIIDYINSRIFFLFPYLIWYVAFFGSAIRGTQWTVVYDSETKEPLSSAIVRTFKGKELYETSLSDANGIVKTTLSKGTYRIQIMLQGYRFPSKLKPLKTDGEYNNLYYGEGFDISTDQRLKINIPLDNTDESVKTASFSKPLRVLYSTIDMFNAYILVIISAVQIVIWPEYIENWVFALVCVFLILLQRFVRRIFEGIPGKIVDRNKSAVPNIKIDLYEADWNKLVESVTSNTKGEYEFVVPNKNYYLRLNNPAYKFINNESEDIVTVKKSEGNSKILRVNKTLHIEKKQ